ncbi:37947_t:CDS:1, partial [Gigaspora margarita]
TWGVRKDFHEEWMSSGAGHLYLTTAGIDCKICSEIRMTLSYSSEGKSVVV